MPRTEHAQPPICIVGAAPDTSNLGVSALFASIVHGLKTRLPDVPLVVFDNGLGVRKTSFRVAKACTVEIELRGLRTGKRFDLPENLHKMNWLSQMGAVGTRLNSNLRCISQARAVLDISGGDSFSDIYGKKRFWSVVLPKQLAIRLGTPLILMPQTYGPYKDETLRRHATQVVSAASAAWARDEHSFRILQDLLGAQFDPAKHRCGVDVAFGLEPVPIANVWSDLQQRFAGVAPGPLIGLNISGLIYSTPEGGKEFGFRSDYKRIVQSFINRLLDETNARLVLFSHVMTPVEMESDSNACRRGMEALPSHLHERVYLSPVSMDQCEVKWLIGQCDWFCGTRMHATIASLSQCVPTATVNYSDKAKSVFESCGQGGEVFDPRVMEADDIVQHLMDSIQRRATIRQSLETNIPKVKAQASSQLDHIAACITSFSAHAPKTSSS